MTRNGFKLELYKMAVTYLHLNTINLKGSLDSSHFIFGINVGKSQIRHRTTLKLNDEFLDRLKIDRNHSNSERSISDPPISDIDFKNKLA